MEHLTAAVKELSRRIDTQQEIIDAIAKQRRDIHWTQIMLAAAAFGVVVALGLGAAVGVLYHRVEVNQQELQQVQARTSTEILCPLYTWFALSLRVNPAPATATAEQIQLRKSASDTINRGLSTLGCAP